MIDIKSIWAQQNPSKDTLIVKTRINAVPDFLCFAATNHITGNHIFLFQISLSTEIPVFRNFKFKGVKIEIFEFETFRELNIYLVDNQLKDIFALFIENIVEVIIDSTTENEAISNTANVIFKWKKLFEKISGPGLTLEQQKGLLGELLFIKNLLEAGISQDKVFNAWTGPDSESKDFNFKSASFEVKFTTSNIPSIKISNENQLDNLSNTNLFLVQFSTDSAKNGGISLNSVVELLRQDLKTNKAASKFFNEKLESVGFFEEDGESYNAEYALKSTFIYKVTADFPKLSGNNLPTGIYNTSYSIERSAIENYKENLESIILTL